MAGTNAKAYHELELRFAKLGHVGDAMAVLSWDTATMMPEGGAASRADQTATLAALCHEMLVRPDMADLLNAAEGETLDDWQRANLAEMRRDWVHAAALPTELVEASSRANSACEMAWREARPNADFSRVIETLTRVLNLTRQSAEIKSQALGVSAYDALLDQYEPGGRSDKIDALFSGLESFLPGILAKALARQKPPPEGPKGPFPAERQRALGVRIMTAMGFDFDHGRLDISRHPFCGGTPDDVRITTRYDEADFIPSLMGVLHETGHALYERGLPEKWRGQPVGRARGMSVHESQSLLMEMQACRSRTFLGFATPLMREAFDAAGQPGYDAEILYDINVRVRPGFIRVNADEVTYPAHVILRYRLEKALIAGDIEIADIPAAWNEAMEKLLGIRPPDDRLGCLQDIHWYDGAFGYFPTYTMGAMTAAQLFTAATRAVPEIEYRIGHGDFAPLLGWLRKNVHGLGSSLPTDELLTRATGRPLDSADFKAHLERRYLGVTS
jgi:carboxypeptidase Taq